MTLNPRKAANAWEPLVARLQGWRREGFVPLRVPLQAREAEAWQRTEPDASVVVGYVRKDRRELLSRFHDALQVAEHEVTVASRFRSPTERSQAFQEMEATLRGENHLPLWRDELYAAKTSFASPTLFCFHRGVGAFFGLATFATHLNGFVRDSTTGSVSHVWLATRSAQKLRYPLLLDTIVGGGVPVNSSALANMVKETHEEAGLEPEWVHSRLQAAGCMQYVVERPRGLVNNTMIVYDLAMPSGVVPVNQDGEVERFDLWPVRDALECLWAEPTRFKPDVAWLLLDFFLRHGILTPDSFTDYERMQRALRSAGNPYDLFNSASERLEKLARTD